MILGKRSARNVFSRLKERAIMSRQQSLNFFPLVGAALLCLLVGTYLFAWKRSSKRVPATTIVKHTVETSADDALKYWTADRMRAAKPAPMPQVTTLDGGKQHPRHPHHHSDPRQA